jgi:hypothetical protein
MRLFRPTFTAPDDGAAPWPGDKVGGLPVGVALPTWPACAQCRRSMSLIAQVRHHPERLDLGAAGRVLTLWQCEHDPGCETWSETSGANAALVVDTADPTALAPPDADTIVYAEVRAEAWTAGDDGVPEDLFPAFFDDDKLAALGEPWETDGHHTRLGGVPWWIQSADEAPGPPWTYVGQVAYGQRLGDGSDRYITGPNFGDSGIAYLFLDRTVDPPAAAMFWQCS